MRLREVAALAACCVLAACDSGPNGPGALSARATGTSLGAAVLEVEGRGIRGFSGRGSTQVYAAAVAARPNVHRVILVDPTGGEIGFDIDVDDRGMEGPIFRVVQASRTDNTTMRASDVTVLVER